MRRARQTDVQAGGHQFTVLRPTHAEAIQLRNAGNDPVTFVSRFTVEWDLTELDLIPGGSPTPAKFDREDFSEWVSDQPDVLAALSLAIVDAYAAHAKQTRETEKN